MMLIGGLAGHRRTGLRTHKPRPGLSTTTTRLMQIGGFGRGMCHTSVTTWTETPSHKNVVTPVRPWDWWCSDDCSRVTRLARQKSDYIDVVSLSVDTQVTCAADNVDRRRRMLKTRRTTGPQERFHVASVAVEVLRRLLSFLTTLTLLLGVTAS